MFTQRPRLAQRVCALCICLLALVAGGLVSQMGWASPQNKRKISLASKPKQISYADIAYAYHGLLLDINLKEIETDRASLERLQDSLLKSLTSEPYLNEKFFPSFPNSKVQRPKPALDKDYANRVLSGFKFTDPERTFIKSALIQLGINSAPPNEREEYQWRFDLIHERTVYQNTGIKDSRPEFKQYIASLNLTEILRQLELSDAADYIARCEDERVPIPPDWPGDAWGRPGILPWEFNFLESGLDTEIYTYRSRSPEGVCYALPRQNGALVGFLGIICQSKSTGKACFWDNVRMWTRCRNGRPDDVPGCRISGEHITLRIAELQGGSVLYENCTRCHRGYNAFIIHPETGLGIPSSEIRDPDVRYSPLGQASWSNPPPFQERRSSACASCHEIADPTPNYCLILEKAADRTMPPGGPPAGWRHPTDAYAASIRDLQTRCPLF